jgi:histone deacetylase 1/2
MMGNGQGVSINSLGQSTFNSPYNPNVPLFLKDLLHVPHISKNLLSVSKFAQDNNVIFEFHPYTCFVKSQDSKQVLLEGTVGADGLYQFKPFKFLSSNNNNLISSTSSFVNSNKSVECNHSLSQNFPCNDSLFGGQCHSTSTPFAFSNIASCNSNTAARSSDNAFQLWHLRLGHANFNAVKSILNLCNVPFNNNNTTFLCTHCCIGKSHRLYAPLSTTVYTNPFEVVHCDLWGPAPFVSYYGYNYYITFVDTYTKYTWIYFLKSKSDALKAFTQFLALIKNQFNASVKALQSDWGGEFRPFTSMLNELGIQHRLTCPHTSHQNGTVERKHRQIVEMGLTLLSHASLPLKFWDHSFTQAVCLINKLPSSAIPQFKSPHHALYKTQPDYSMLRTFGCLCFPHLRPYNRHKLQFRSSPCVYLGISPQHKGHKCLDATGRIFISKDVQFHESQFPYVSLFSTASGSYPQSSNGSYPAYIDFPSQISPINPAVPTHTASPTPPDTSAPLQSQTHSSNEQSPSLTHNSYTHEPITPLPVPAATSPSSSASPNLTPPAPPLLHQNDHPMVTRGKTGNLKPKVFLAELEPKTVKSALQDPKWLQAMQAEYQALMHNHTWSLVPLPPHKKAIGCKWVFRVKENPDGTVNKFKARLVAKGFLQTAGFDFTETFSPVIKPITIRIILTLAVTFKWQVQQIDINNAFLNGILQEEVYMTQPAGFEASDKSLVCKLHKSLYGLKQAPRAWYDRLTQTLLNLGFVKSRCDPSLLVHNQKGACTYVLIYVDDILITGSSSQLISDLIHKLNMHFALKQLGQVDYFLGIEVHHLPSGALLLNQTKYIRDLLCKTAMEDSTPIGSPMVSNCRLSKFGTDILPDPTLYRSTVGALQYATLTRPDIAFSVNKVCQFMSQPLESHWKAVKRILRYLKGTLSHGLLLAPSPANPPFSLRAYSDADWATDQDDRRSTSGSCIYFGPNLVSWGSKKQQLVARSSTEAEYRSMANTTADLLWIQSLLCELQVPFHTPTLLCDNLSAVSLSHNPILHAKTKHIELDIHFVREKVLSKQLHVLHVPAIDQLADPLTKPLSPANFASIRTKLKVFPLSPALSLQGG